MRTGLGGTTATASTTRTVSHVVPVDLIMAHGPQVALVLSPGLNDREAGWAVSLDQWGGLNPRI